MQERIHSQRGSDVQLGQSVLYFGCRHSDQDYLYGPQLQQWSEEGSLTLFTAFSRQQVSAVHPCRLVYTCLCPEVSYCMPDTKKPFCTSSTITSP